MSNVKASVQCTLYTKFGNLGRSANIKGKCSTMLMYEMLVELIAHYDDNSKIRNILQSDEARTDIFQV